MTATQNAALAWAAASRIAEKQTDKEQIPEGLTTPLLLSFYAEVDGKKALDATAEGIINVGVGTTRVSSGVPSASAIAAYLLTQMPKTRRAAILANLPTEYAAAGGEFPGVQAADVEAAKQLCQQIRAAQPQPCRGTVSVQCAVESIA